MSLVRMRWQRWATYFRLRVRGSVHSSREAPSLLAVLTASLAGIVLPLWLLLAFGSNLHSVVAWALSLVVWASTLFYGFRQRSDFRRQSDRLDFDRYKALREALGDLVMHHEPSGRVVWVGEEAPRFLSVGTSELLGGGFFNRIHVMDRPAFLQAINSAHRGDEAVSVTIRLRSGSVLSSLTGFDEPVFVWAETRLRRLPGSGADGSSDQAGGLVSIVRNISQIKEAEQRFEAARTEAVLAVSMKDRLLANVSHELRTPLNAILGFSEILGNVELAPTEPAKQIEYARIIHSSAEHLLSVVNLVLDMSKIEAGKFEIAAEPFELEPLIKDCCDMLRLKAENGKVALVRADASIEQELIADKRACRQILLNLMSNAVKFTPAGGRVTVGADVVGSMLHIYVADTGIGIPADDLPRLGDPFFQVRSHYGRSFEGAGLGLSLVRGLVGLHGGTLLLESVLGVGTRVTAKLPLDCRSASGAGVGAPRLETVASLGEATTNLRVFEERKIA